MSWQPMSRDDAQAIIARFFQRRGPFTMSFEQHVQLIEAFGVISGEDPDTIRRKLEEEWGVPLD